MVLSHQSTPFILVLKCHSHIRFTELSEQVVVLKSMEQAVASELDQAKQGLAKAKEGRVTFLTSVQHIQEWLSKSEQLLNQPVCISTCT